MKSKQLAICLLLIASFLITVRSYDSEKGWSAILDGWYCLPGEYSDYTQKQSASYGLLLTSDNKFSKCILNSDTTISSKLIPGCMLYDSNYNCLECDCDKGLNVDGTECLDNYVRVPYCAKYNGSESCIECKFSYNEKIVSGNSGDYPPSKTFSTDNKLDYGLYQGKCYNNLNTSASYAIAGCKKYDDSSSLDGSINCNVCHYKSQWTSTWSQTNYYSDASATPSFYKYKLYLYKASSSARTTCSYIPETYESDISNMKYLLNNNSESDKYKAQLFYKCNDNFALVGNVDKTLTGFSYTIETGSDEGCSDSNTKNSYALNGCYKVDSKNADPTECLTSNTTISSTYFTVNVSSSTYLKREDQNTILCHSCSEADLVFDVQYKKCVLASNVAYCASYQFTSTDYEDYQCIACSSGYILSDSQNCWTTISNCKTQSTTTEGQCDTCQPYYILKSDKTECIFQESFTLTLDSTTNAVVSQIGCISMDSNDPDSCGACNTTIGFGQSKIDDTRYRCVCSTSKNYLENPLVLGFCKKPVTSTVTACSYSFMNDLRFGIDRYDCSDCERSFDHQFCASSSSTSSSSCLKYDSSNTNWCVLCKNSSYSINDQGLCVMNTTEDGILNSGSNNCEHMDYFLNQFFDNQLLNCIKYDTATGLCLQCIDGYGLNTTDSLSCIQNSTLTTDLNCSTISNTDSSKCAICLPGYYLNAQSTACLAPTTLIDNCYNYASDTICSLCKYPYGLNSAKTTCSLPNNCSVANPTNSAQCYVCQSGFYLNFDGLCYSYQTIDNCDTYSSDNSTCTKCQTGYGFKVVNGYQKCATLDNCVTPDPTKVAYCNLCSDLYYSKDGTCTLGSVTNCIKYDKSANTCSQCSANYYLDSNACKTSSDQNCLYPLDNTHCSVCNPYYYVSTDGSCQKVSEKVIPNCLEYSSKTSNNLICSKCISGYALSSNACTSTASINNCKTLNQSDATRCAQCNDNYYLGTDNKTCEQQDTVTNCGTYYSNKKGCQQCSDESIQYLTSQGQCVESGTIANCQTLIQLPATDALKGLCGFCSEGNSFFDLTSFTCDNTENTHCAIVSSTGACTNCIPGYYWDGTTCTAATSFTGCIKTEKQPDDSFKCTLCYDWNTQYPQLQEGVYTCTARGDYYNPTFCSRVANDTLKCLECQSGYQLQLSDYSCRQATITNCKTVDPLNSTNCIACNTDYEYRNGACVTGNDLYVFDKCFNYTNQACQNCTNSLYDSVSVACVDTSTQSNCDSFDYSNSANCLQCSTGYYFDSSTQKCKAIDFTPVTNCQYYNSSQKCVQCNTGYALADNTCNKPDNCATALTQTICQKCADGYYQYDSGRQCIQSQVLTIPNCYSYSSILNCALCFGNLVPDENSANCVNNVKDPYCQTISSSDPTVCAVCSPLTYYSSSDKACKHVTSVIEGCTTYSGATTCSGCKSNYILSGNTCSKIGNCLEGSNSKCIICEPPYMVTTSGSCQLQYTLSDSIYKVDNYKMYKMCTLCRAGYKLNTENFPNNGTGEICVPDTPDFLQDSLCTKYTTGKICTECSIGATLVTDIYNQTYCAKAQFSDSSMCVAYEPYSSSSKSYLTCLICSSTSNVAMNPLTHQCEQADGTTKQSVKYLGDSIWNRMVIQCMSTSTQALEKYTGKCETSSVEYCYYMKNGVCQECIQDQDYGLITVGSEVKCYSNVNRLPITYCKTYNSVASSTDLSTATCSECKFGYTLNSDGTNCTQAITNCTAYGWTQIPSNPNQLYCTKCAVGYRYDYSSGQCLSYNNLKADIVCSLVNSKGDCVYCPGPYLLQDGKCYLKIPNCLTQDKDTCSECLTGFYLNSNTCSTNKPGCETMDGSDCTKCSNSCPNKISSIEGFTNFQVWNWRYYGLDSSKNCQEGCVSFDSSNLCTGCASFSSFDCNKTTFATGEDYNISPYYLSNGKCLRRTNFVKYCSVYSTTYNYCVQCLNTYYANLTDDQSSVWKCTKCQNLAAYPLDCEIETNNCTCLSCNQQTQAYYNSTTQACVKRTVTTGCTSYNDDSDTCASCNFYYKLNSNGSCIYDTSCYSWKVNSSSGSYSCDYCNDTSQGKYYDTNNNLICINNSDTSYTKNCDTYIDNIDSTAKVCSICKKTESAKYVLVRLQEQSGSTEYSLQCRLQTTENEFTDIEGCAEYDGQSKFICTTPENPDQGSNCPKVNLTDYYKWDCISCIYYNKTIQYGLMYDSSEEVHYCVNSAKQIEGCENYTDDNEAKCTNCWYDYQKVSSDSSSTVNFEEEVIKCQYIHTFCKNIGCLLLKSEQTREWPKCKICQDEYDINMGNEWCDQVDIDNVDGGGVPNSTVDYGTGIDGGLTWQPDPYTPTPTSSRLLSLGVEAILLLALGVFAFIL